MSTPATPLPAPLLVTGLDPQHPIPSAVLEQFAQQLKVAQDGSIITFPLAIQIYQRIDGYWMRTEDLPHIVNPAPTPAPSPAPAPSTAT